MTLNGTNDETMRRLHRRCGRYKLLWMGIVAFSLTSSSVDAQDKGRAVRSQSGDAQAEDQAPAVSEDLFESLAPARSAASYDVLSPLAQELAARGEKTAAERLLAAVKMTESDFDRLTRRLLQLNQLAAAEELLQSWLRQEPRSTTARWLLTILRHSSGQPELALRELVSLQRRASAENRFRVVLYQQLLQMQTRGIPPSNVANPWDMQFVSATGAFAPSAIAPAELQKLVDAWNRLGFDFNNDGNKVLARTATELLELAKLLPMQGNIWALLGELLNAAGDPRSALVCFYHSERVLLFSNLSLREHRRVLEDYARDAEAAAEVAIGQAVPGSSATSGNEEVGPAAEDPGWGNLTSRPRLLLVVVIGGGLIALLLVLQLREWAKAVRSNK